MPRTHEQAPGNRTEQPSTQSGLFGMGNLSPKTPGTGDDRAVFPVITPVFTYAPNVVV